MVRRKNMLFTILPDKGFTATYVAIDTDCLKVLKVCHPQPRKRKAPKLEEPDVASALKDPDEAGKAAKLEVWSKRFNFKGLQTANHKFGFHVSTDGVGASVKMERPKSEAAAPGNLVLEGKRIVDINSRTTDFFSAVDADNAKVKCSTAECYHHVRFNQSKAWHERKLHRAANGLEEWQGATPSSRTSSVASIQAHVAYVTLRLQEALAFHGTHQQRRQRWNCHIRKQSCLHVMAKRLAGGMPKDQVGTMMNVARTDHHCHRVCSLTIVPPCIASPPCGESVPPLSHRVEPRHQRCPQYASSAKVLGCWQGTPRGAALACSRIRWEVMLKLDVLQAVTDGLAEAAAVEDAATAEDG